MNQKEAAEKEAFDKAVEEKEAFDKAVEEKAAAEAAFDKAVEEKAAAEAAFDKAVEAKAAFDKAVEAKAAAEAAFDKAVEAKAAFDKAVEAKAAAEAAFDKAAKAAAEAEEKAVCAGLLLKNLIENNPYYKWEHLICTGCRCEFYTKNKIVEMYFPIDYAYYNENALCPGCAADTRNGIIILDNSSLIKVDPAIEKAVAEAEAGEEAGEVKNITIKKLVTNMKARYIAINRNNPDGPVLIRLHREPTKDEKEEAEEIYKKWLDKKKRPK